MKTLYKWLLYTIPVVIVIGNILWFGFGIRDSIAYVVVGVVAGIMPAVVTVVTERLRREKPANP